MITWLKIASILNYKIRKGLAGRRQSCNLVKAKISKTDKVLWMHAASLGEYEQGLPVLQMLKEKLPEHKVLVTFFSPSGYESVIKKNHLADVVCYLPFDRKVWVREFVSHFQPDVFFTVKYDFWYNLLSELKLRNSKIYVVSALFYETQIYFKPYGNWFLKQLSANVDWFFNQTKHSTVLAKSIGLTNSSTSGDTRFDRVKQILQRDNFVEFISEFKDNQQLVVFGSSWEHEERLAEILAKKHRNLKIILAPHDLKRVEFLKNKFPNALIYSELLTSNVRFPASQILIIDSIGLLSKLYSYADFAVVGGGFHNKGLHNILEAAVFGIPVFFGNRYRKNPEADALISAGGAHSFEDEFFAERYISELLKNPEKIKTMDENSTKFIENQPNATEIVVKQILTDLII